MNVEEILSKAINCLMDRRLSNAIEVLEQLYHLWVTVSLKLSKLIIS